MHARGERDSIVSLLCDRGERYEQPLFDPRWPRTRDIDPAPARDILARYISGGERALASAEDA